MTATGFAQPGVSVQHAAAASASSSVALASKDLDLARQQLVYTPALIVNAAAQALRGLRRLDAGLRAMGTRSEPGSTECG